MFIDQSKLNMLLLLYVSLAFLNGGSVRKKSTLIKLVALPQTSTLHNTDRSFGLHCLIM